MKKVALKSIFSSSLCVLFAIMLLHAAVFLSANAATNGSTNATTLSVAASSANASEENYFQSKLEDALAREIYDAYVTHYFQNKEYEKFTLELSEKIEFNYSTGYDDIQNSIKNSYSMATAAFLYDYPEVFWINNIGYSFITSISGNTGTVSELEFTPEISYSGAYSQLSSFKNGVASAVVEINANALDDTRYERLKAIHDYICNNVEYNDAAANDSGNSDYSYAYTAAPVFVDDRAVVCEGYAKAFKVLCDEYDIPCILVVGDGVTNSGTGAHMWNYVQMENGKWYAVDVTWDDQSSIRYDYFLAGSTSEGFYKKFSEDHITDGEFDYPTLSDTAYNKDTNGTTTTNSTTTSTTTTTTTNSTNTSKSTTTTANSTTTSTTTTTTANSTNTSKSTTTTTNSTNTSKSTTTTANSTNTSKSATTTANSTNTSKSATTTANSTTKAAATTKTPKSVTTTKNVVTTTLKQGVNVTTTTTFTTTSTTSSTSITTTTASTSAATTTTNVKQNSSQDSDIDFIIMVMVFMVAGVGIIALVLLILFKKGIL